MELNAPSEAEGQRLGLGWPVWGLVKLELEWEQRVWMSGLDPRKNTPIVWSGEWG